MTLRKDLLRSFVYLLKRNGLIQTESLREDSNEGFSNRLKLQKYVFIVRHFGLDMNYSFSLYLHGPYSPELAKDYYSLNFAETTAAPLPKEFKADEFLSLVKGKDERWLEAVATAMDLATDWGIKDNKECKMLADHIKLMKPHVADYADDAVNYALVILR